MKFTFVIEKSQFKYVVVEANNNMNAVRLINDQLLNIDWSEVESVTDFLDFKDENGLTMRDYENINDCKVDDDYLPPHHHPSYIDQKGY
jgi:hypothetical protein